MQPLSVPLRRRAQLLTAAAVSLFIFFMALREQTGYASEFRVPVTPDELDPSPENPSEAEGRPGSSGSNQTGPAPPPPPPDSPGTPSRPSQPEPLPQDACRQLPGAEDVLVVLKTGATEAHDKLPVHFGTTFRCTPNFVVFSDMDEEIQGHRLHDVLDETDEETKNAAEEFKLYQEMGEWRDARTMRNDAETHERAWNLDKWKFLPLMKKALEFRPESKWFVFIEADTYLVWSNLLQWLPHLDHEEPLYIGGQSWVVDTEFAHGGTGVVVSNRALKMVVEEYTLNIPKYNDLTQKEWAGDLILAKAFQAVGIRLLASWPVMQGETPYTLDYTARHWCYPVVSYHHMPPEWIETMWGYEQSWINSWNDFKPGTLPGEPLRHRDTFDYFVAPQISAGVKVDWDNLSPEQPSNREGDHSAEACNAVCEATPDCVSWLYISSGKCTIADAVRLGKEVPENEIRKTSGWMLDRVDAFRERLGACKADWILP